MDNAEEVFDLYQQCSAEVKLKRKFSGSLQIHHETMQLLTKHPSFNESESHAEKDKTNDVPSSWKVDPILAIRSIFVPRRTSSKDDSSEMVLPGRRITVESDGCGSSASKMWKQKQHQELEFEGFSELDSDEVRLDSNSIIQVPKPNGFYSRAVEHGEELDMLQIPVERGTPGRPQDNLGIGRSTLFALDERRVSVDRADCGGSEPLVLQDTQRNPQEMLGKRRSSNFVVGERGASIDRGEFGGECCRIGGGEVPSCEDSIGNEVLRHRSFKGEDGKSLICEFPSPNTSPGCRGTSICDWKRQQSNASESSLSNPEELICGWDEDDVSQESFLSWTTLTD